MADRMQELASGLERVLTAAGLPGAVEGLVRLSGGASRETFALDLVDGAARRPLILQRVRKGTVGGGPGMQGEAALIRAAAEVGVPVPTVVADDDGSELGGPAMVLDRLEGETIARKLLRDAEFSHARTVLVDQAGAALAAIHRIPADTTALRDEDQVDQLRGLADIVGQPLPAIELGLRWLDAHRPRGSQHTVVHGDFRLGNLMVGVDGLRGVLDWELSHLGDPIEDLGWYCVRAWRFGSPLPAGGTGTREQLCEAYEAAGGAPVDPEALRWWEVLGTLKWGLICGIQASAHLTGASRSVELATIGRRICENEWDLLALLPGGPLPDDGPPELAAPTDLYGRPTALELVEAVREWVDGDVREGTEGRLSFHARVATNALRMVERELAYGPAHAAAHAARLAELGCADEAELAARIRSGELDARAEEVRRSVAATARARLQVSNPGWLEPDA